MKSKFKTLSLILFMILVIIAVMLQTPVGQDAAYHNFSDQRMFFGIPNFFDSLSNLAFILAGIIGLRYILTGKTVITDNTRFSSIDRLPFYTFFISIILIGAGSFFYHLKPDNFRLVFDRLPMATAFISFFTLLISERINRKSGVFLTIPLLLLGIFSVLYWYYTESRGMGDLRIYALVQYLPMLMIIIIILLYPGKYTQSKDILIVIGLYASAKCFELFDSDIYTLTTIISGHTIKHLTAAYAIYWFARMLRINRTV